MRDRGYVITELFILFIGVPLSLLLDYTVWIKVATVLVAFGYLVFVLLRKLRIKFAIKKEIDWIAFWKRTLIKFVIVIITTTAYVWLIDKPKLLCVPKNDVQLWVVILLIYSLLSVWPQEIIYRTFFLERYRHLFKDKRMLVFVNAVIFSLAHIFFKNLLVTVLTFIGGLVFAYTYYHTKSTTLVSIEHALYGNWLFTVGMGDMLAFPGMESC